jgi:tRNA-specific 2-thiouridylase
LRQPQLQRALTPLGGMSKPAIREIARSLGLKVADKVDSQEICFVPGNDYKAFLRSHLGENEFHRGGIYNLAGEFLGEHGGLELFTIGQRKGLPGGSSQPRYVVDLDPATNRVIVGNAEDLVSEEFEIDRVNWQPAAGVGDPGHEGALEVTVKIRYSHPGTRATLTPLDQDRARLRLHEPQKAVTPGQAAVFYEGDIVLGGGWICRQTALAFA